MKCKLCRKNVDLVDSHLIPKFVFDWLKKTGTGKIRGLSNPSKPIQDGIKVKLLCQICENKIGVAETYFAKTIFYPVVNQDITKFEYNEKLRYFAVSVFWRLINDSLLQEVMNTKWYKIVQDIENQFWEYLWLDQKKDIINQIQLLIGVDLIKDQDFILENDKKNQFILYFARGIDAGIPYSEEKIFLFFKIPRMLFLIPLHKYSPKTFLNANVKGSGKYIINEVVFDDQNFSSFLSERVNQIIHRRAEISEKQKIKSHQNYLNQKDLIDNKDLGKIYQYLQRKL